MLDLVGYSMTAAEEMLLREPEVGGLILFGRNFNSCEQLATLTSGIRAIRPDLLIAVDHEGGRVQRFRDGFTRLPPMAAFGLWYDRDPFEAVDAARECGWLLAMELLQFDIDFSFTPVLDLGYHGATIIGDRAFHREPEAVVALAGALVAGMAEAGMAAVGKHFPGHGYVEGDTHTDMPVDERSLDELLAADIRPFERLMEQGLGALMPAHVVYPAVDNCPAGFSRVWLQDLVRERMGYTGIIFSDDLSMAAAGVAGTVQARAEAALAAGCDMVLVCNDPAAATTVLDWLKTRPGQYRPPLGTLSRRTAAGAARQDMQGPRYARAKSELEKLLRLWQAETG